METRKLSMLSLLMLFSGLVCQVEAQHYRRCGSPRATGIAKHTRQRSEIYVAPEWRAERSQTAPPKRAQSDSPHTKERHQRIEMIDDSPLDGDANAFRRLLEAPAEDPQRFRAGQIVDLGIDYGLKEPGSVLLVLGKVDLRLPAIIWSPDSVTFQIPAWLNPPKPVYGSFLVKRADGETIRRKAFILDNGLGAQIVTAEELQTSIAESDVR